MEKTTKTSQCPHVEAVGDNSWEDVIKRKRIQTVCEQCTRNGPNLWLCLHDRCLYVACGETGEDCSTQHGKLEKHHLTMNMTSMRIWCYKCECEVYRDGNHPPFIMYERSVIDTPLSAPSTPDHRGGGEYCPNHMSHSRKHSPQPEEEESSEDDDEDMDKPRGLTGLQNIGNTCYMNAALQALSNCPPLTRFFLDCSGVIQLVPPDRKPALSRSFGKLLAELWHTKRPAYVVPSSIASGIKMVHPMFRGYTQQDTQEFLRCFMDQMHEELKQAVIEDESDDEDQRSAGEPANEQSCNNLEIERLSSKLSQTSSKSKDSDNEYETCESGLTSERSSVENSVTNDDNAHSETNNVPTKSPCDRSLRKTIGKVQSDSKINQSHLQDIEKNSAPAGDCVKSVVSTESCLNYSQSDSCIPLPTGSSVEDLCADESNSSAICDVTSATPGSAVGSKYSPPVTRSSQKPQRMSSHKEIDVRASDSGIGSSISDISVQSSNTNNNLTTTAKDIKDSANIAHQKHCFHDDKFPGRVMRQSESETNSFDSQTPEKGEIVNSSSRGKSPRSRQTSENATVTHTTVSVKSSQSLVKRKPKRYHSVISDVFDGRVLSSVQCLTCERISTTKETFQDLSLPIPNKDHLQMIHNQPPTHVLTGGSHKTNSCGEVNMNQGWFSWMFGWMRSWFWGPTVKLQDCLAAFFSADELKGDNMYSCEKCKKLRNGVKFSRVLKLPEILCVHLKRFRHEFMFSTKIATHVTFPMDGLDMGPYLHKDCTDQTTHYDLVAIICHHGTAGGGHYTAYCLNYINETWYEFDDQYVTAVDIQTVENCEAYVLFYRKRNEEMLSKRKKAQEIVEAHENSFMRFFVSRQWINKFNMFAEPGPITNHDFLCKHGGVHPHKWENVNGLVMEVSQVMWEYLHKMYGGGPAVTHLYMCTTCKEEMERLKFRQLSEKDTFIRLNDEFTREEWSRAIYAISISWFKLWENFVKDRTDEPPGPIDNSRICIIKSGVPVLKHNSEYGQISEEMWKFLSEIYAGGPEVLFRPSLKTDSQYSRNADPDEEADDND